MDAKDFWQIFMDTGAPEVYLMYHKAKLMEDGNVLDDPSAGAAGNCLQ